MTKIKITHIETAPEYIKITKREYNQLTKKSALYDNYKAAQRERGRKLQSQLTPQERSERGRKAIAARWSKYNKEGSK